ncbi:radical SAM protein [Micromonospora sp. NPDC049240]|uniref:radical SAM protein n=1 Tax=Micromonospora sp. NPDC049240 TaxID=3155151 RepID=UPI0033D8251E
MSTADQCAVNCRFCFRADTGRDVLSLDTYARALSRLRELGVEELCLSGGEPTDHPEFRQLVRVALQFGFRVAVVTAARPGPRLDALASAAGMLSHVTVSADSRRADELGRTGRTITSALPVLAALGHHRATLHVTCYEVGEDDLADIKQVVTAAQVPVEVSPLLHSPTYRFDNPHLDADLELIKSSFGLSDDLRGIVTEYRTWLRAAPQRPCGSERVYLSADGHLRRCPYHRPGQVSVHAPRQQIQDGLVAMFTDPPHTQLSCLAICRPENRG